MSVKQGREAKLYVAEGGIGGVPTWQELSKARNVRLVPAGGEIDLSCRGSGYKLTGVGLMDVTIDADLLYDAADAAIQAVETAFVTKALLGVACTSFGVSQSGSRVFKADCVVTKFERAEDLEGTQMIACAFKPTLSDDPPTWETIA